MALTLAIGILIDDAIVVRENIVRHLELRQDHVPGRPRRHRRDRPGRHGDHLHHRGGVHPRGLHGRHRRPVLLPVRHHGLGGRARLALRELHPRSDALVALGRPAGAWHRSLRPHREWGAGARQPGLSRSAGLVAALAQDDAADRAHKLRRKFRLAQIHRLRVRTPGRPRRAGGVDRGADRFVVGIYRSQAAPGRRRGARIPRDRLHLRHRQHRLRQRQEPGEPLSCA